jgi:uncharacterized protein (UPF0548 family)
VARGRLAGASRLSRPRIGPRSRVVTAAAWPVGITLTAWSYLWRTTPLHRRELPGDEVDQPPVLPPAAGGDDVQPSARGVGPFFHRRYRIRVRNARLSPEDLLQRIAGDLNGVAPSSFARFIKTHGDPREMAVGDEYVVRMPGPWDGPVRVVAHSPRSFRLVTLDGHLEAGQIEFRCGADQALVFEIESWARSGDWLSNLLYARLRFAKEVQLHLWVSVLERVARLAGGRITGGIEIETRRVEDRAGSAPPRGSRRIRRRLAELPRAELKIAPEDVTASGGLAGWRVDDLSQQLPSEPPGPPLPDGSFAVARRLMHGYQFADPSIVRAFYDPEEPLAGRTMLLQVRFHGLRFDAGVRVQRVDDRRITTDDGRPAAVWGWSYATLRGHFEMGEMAWQVWKLLDTGEVQFRIHAYSRRAPVTNPLIRIGFRLVGRREQLAFLASTQRRMAVLTAIALEQDPRRLRDASSALTARDGGTAPDDRELVRNAGLDSARTTS